jgi:hypothetical protein
VIPVLEIFAVCCLGSGGPLQAPAGDTPPGCLVPAGSDLLPFENFLDVNGEFRHIKGDIRLAPVRHMTPFGGYHATGNLMQREQRHGAVAPALPLSSCWQCLFVHR